VNDAGCMAASAAAWMAVQGRASLTYHRWGTPSARHRCRLHKVCKSGDYSTCCCLNSGCPEIRRLAGPHLLQRSSAGLASQLRAIDNSHFSGLKNAVGYFEEDCWLNLRLAYEMMTVLEDR